MGEILRYGTLEGPAKIDCNIFDQVPYSPAFENASEKFDTNLVVVRSLTSSLVRKEVRAAGYHQDPLDRLNRLAEDMTSPALLKNRRLSPAVSSVLSSMGIPPDEREIYYLALADAGTELAEHELILSYLSLYQDKFRNNGEPKYRGDPVQSYVQWITNERPGGISGTQMQGIETVLPRGFPENGHVIYALNKKNPKGTVHGTQTGIKILQDEL